MYVFLKDLGIHIYEYVVLGVRLALPVVMFRVAQNAHDVLQ
jgi:hypothetical protein